MTHSQVIAGRKETQEKTFLLQLNVILPISDKYKDLLIARSNI